MVQKHIQPILDWLKHVVTQPREELNNLQTAVRFSYDLGVHGWRALMRDDAWQMAAALAYRTLFALLPVMIVSTVLLRALQGVDQFKALGHNVINAIGLDEVRLPAPKVEPKTPAEVQAEKDAEEAERDKPAETQGQEEEVSGAPPSIEAADGAATDAAAAPVQPGSAAPETVALGEWLEEVIAGAAAMDLATLGWAGLAVVIYSAIGLMVTIENSFNAIYGAPHGRSWSRRITVYWFVLTLSPLVIVLTLYIDGKFEAIIASTGAWSWVLTIAKFAWGFGVAWLLMFAIYRSVPNTAVRPRAALAGGFVAAAFLTIGRQLLAGYFQNAASFSTLYASLGAIPLFIFWVYLMWLVVLFGLEVAATVQRLQTTQLDQIQEQDKRPRHGLVDPASVLNVMEVVTERFAAGRGVSSRELADETAIPEHMICQMIDRLVREGFLHRVEGADSSVSLSRPPDQIHADRLIEIGFGLVDEGGIGRQSMLITRLREMQTRLAGEVTLASLLTPSVAGGKAEDQVAVT